MRARVDRGEAPPASLATRSQAGSRRRDGHRRQPATAAGRPRRSGTAGFLYQSLLIGPQANQMSHNQQSLWMVPFRE